MPAAGFVRRREVAVVATGAQAAAAASQAREALSGRHCSFAGLRSSLGADSGALRAQRRAADVSRLGSGRLTLLCFNKYMCAVLEDERRSQLLRNMHCGTGSYLEGGNGSIDSTRSAATDESQEEEEQLPMVVAPTAQSSGCRALVDFLSLRSQLQHLNASFPVAGNVPRGLWRSNVYCSPGYRSGMNLLDTTSDRTTRLNPATRCCTIRT